MKPKSKTQPSPETICNDRFNSLDVTGRGDDLPLVGQDGVDLVPADGVDGHAAAGGNTLWHSLTGDLRSATLHNKDRKKCQATL